MSSTKPHLFTSNNNLRRHASAKVPQRRQMHPLDGRKMGEAAHQVIALILEQGHREATYKELQAVVAQHPSTGGAIVYRQSAKQRLLFAAQAYLSYCLPPDSWTFVGAEVSAPSCRFDLVWLDDDGSYWVDEMKTGNVADRVARTQLEEQVERERRGGVQFYGERFAGVRVCIVRAPQQSYCVLADGERIEGKERAWLTR